LAEMLLGEQTVKVRWESDCLLS